MVRDLRYALRQLRRSPAFAIAVVLTLAIAIAANTAIFSVVRAVLLEPLPYKDAGRLLCLWHSDSPDYTWYTFSYPRFQYFQQHLADLTETAAYDDETVTLTYKGQPVRLEGGRVSSNFFSLLGVKPAIGRSFLPSEDLHGAPGVALLGDKLWRQRYGADPKIVGRTIAIDSEDFTVIGVIPGKFPFPRRRHRCVAQPDRGYAHICTRKRRVRRELSDGGGAFESGRGAQAGAGEAERCRRTNMRTIIQAIAISRARFMRQRCKTKYLQACI